MCIASQQTINRPLCKIAIKALRILRNNRKKNAETIGRVEKALDIQLNDIHNEPKKIILEEMELV
ncbi:MAG: hypothetical protein RLZZ306_3508 [Bacteroidota bacterium]|jgi:hypothetical protein